MVPDGFASKTFVATIAMEFTWSHAVQRTGGEMSPPVAR